MELRMRVYLGLLILINLVVSQSSNNLQIKDSAPLDINLKDKGNTIYQYKFDDSFDFQKDSLHVSLSLCNYTSATNSLLDNTSFSLFYSIPSDNKQIDDLIWSEISLGSTIHEIIPKYNAKYEENNFLKAYYSGYRTTTLNFMKGINPGKQLYLKLVSNLDKADFKLVVSKEYILDIPSFDLKVNLVDTDDKNALFFINNTGLLDFSSTNYKLYYTKKDDLKFRLNTFCSIMKNGNKFKQVNSESIVENYEYIEQTERDDSSQYFFQFRLNELDPDTNYILYLIYPNPGYTNIGKVFLPVFFKTKLENTNCKLIDDPSKLGECKHVDYAIPVLDGKVEDALIKYNAFTSDAIKNFTNLVTQYDCEQHQYSLVRNCEDCKAAYISWLCTVAIPKCTDKVKISPNSLDTNSHPIVVHREKADGIKPLVYDQVNVTQFYEVKPCIDLCYNVMQSCPTAFNFKCPLSKSTLTYSYSNLDNNELRLRWKENYIKKLNSENVNGNGDAYDNGNSELFCNMENAYVGLVKTLKPEFLVSNASLVEFNLSIVLLCYLLLTVAS